MGNQADTKRRRLNTSESYSINNDNSNNESDDDYVVSDKIELAFAIKFRVALNSDVDTQNDSYHKEHKCVFNDDEDSACGGDSSVCSFATETFAELTQRI